MSSSNKSEDLASRSAGVGVALGAALGAAFDHIAIGVALGAAIGSAYGAISKNKQKTNIVGHTPEDGVA